MPFSPLDPSTYFDDADLAVLVALFSDRVRREPALHASLNRLVGNRWEQAEQRLDALFRAALTLTSLPQVDRDWLSLATQLLGSSELRLLADLMLDCAMVAFPLQSASLIVEISERLGELVESISQCDGAERQSRLAAACDRLASGALMNGF